MLSGIHIQSVNPDFMFTTACGTTLAANASCLIQVEFEPHAVGADSGTLTVVDSDRTQQVTLTGTGELANITLTPGSLDFGVTGVQVSSAMQTLLLSNGSTGTLTGISIATSGPFGETTTCGTNLPSGGICTLSLTFSPTAAGSQSGVATVNSTNGAPMTTQLTGTGIAFELTPTSPTSVTVTSGNAASYSLELTPASGSTGSATISCANLPPNATCTVTPANAALTAPSNIQVAVATGVGSSTQMRHAGIMGWVPWPVGLLLLVVTLGGIRRSHLDLKPGIHRLMLVILLASLIGGMGACGNGGGVLGSGAPPPINSTTPPGTYTVTVAASAGGLDKSVNLTVQVQ
jgi:hypothetical protein